MENLWYSSHVFQWSFKLHGYIHLKRAWLFDSQQILFLWLFSISEAAVRQKLR